MFGWYRDAEICIAYLADVSSSPSTDNYLGDFKCSAWFTRGWTLQELIAPKKVTFVQQAWLPFGSRFSLSTSIEDITGIPSSLLLSQSILSDFSIAQRMSWAATRETTRVEDRAYSLMGLFDVYMPTIYGEGRAAFRRLQEEIMKRSSDQMLFVWEPSEYYFRSKKIHRSGMLAEDPRDFMNCADVARIPMKEMSQAAHAFLVFLRHRYSEWEDWKLPEQRMRKATTFATSPSLPPRIPTFSTTNHAILINLPLINSRLMLSLSYLVHTLHEMIDSISVYRFAAWTLVLRSICQYM